MLANALYYAKNTNKLFKDALKLKTMEEQNAVAKLIRLIQVRMQLTKETTDKQIYIYLYIFKMKVTSKLNSLHFGLILG